MYFAANLGLSLRRTYAGLLILRMIQSIGASGKNLLFKIVNKADDVGTIALCLGVIRDIASSALFRA